AAIAQPHRRGVARQLVQLDARRFLVLIGGLGVVQHLEERRALRLELLDGLAALLFAQLHCELGHGFSLSRLAWGLASGPAGTGNGTPRAARAPRCRTSPRS